jgi:hypothetical protein
LVKTLRIFSGDNRFQLQKTILLETLPFKTKEEMEERNEDDADVTYNCYPSFLQFESKIYYFKRIYGKPEYLPSKPSRANKPPSYLQLFKYDLASKEEEDVLIENYYFYEDRYFLNPVFAKNFGNCFMVMEMSTHDL